MSDYPRAIGVGGGELHSVTHWGHHDRESVRFATRLASLHPEAMPTTDAAKALPLLAEGRLRLSAGWDADRVKRHILAFEKDNPHIFMNMRDDRRRVILDLVEMGIDHMAAEGSGE